MKESRIEKELFKNNKLTNTELKHMREDYHRLQEMLSAYQSRIIGKKEKALEIQELLNDLQRQAAHLIFLGENYGNVISQIRTEIDKLTDRNLDIGLDDYHNTVLNLITFLLNRGQKNFVSGCVKHSEFRSIDVGRGVVINDHFDLIAKESVWPQDRLDIFDLLKYLNLLCDVQEPFIISVYDSLNNDTTISQIRSICERDNVALLSSWGRWQTFCFSPDHDITFRKVIMKIMLFSELHGLPFDELNESNIEQYAQAIESMDVESYSLIPNPERRPKELILVPKQKH